MNKNVQVFFQFIRRDIYVYSSRLPRYLLQYGMFYALLYGTCFGYFLPTSGMNANQATGSTVIFVGLILYALFALNFVITAEFFFDFESDRYIDYQLLLLPPKLLMLQKLFFNTCLLFVSLLPFYPSLKSIFGSSFDLSHASFIKTAIIFLVACLMFSAYYLLLTCVMKQLKSMRYVWRRLTYPMIMFGGFLIPWKVMNTYSPVLGNITSFNPVLYATEGLRGAMLGGDNYFSFGTSVSGMLIFTVIFMLLTFHFFKKKTDHI